MSESIIKDPSAGARNYVVFSSSCTTVSMAGNSSDTITADIQKTGYTPISVVGVKLTGTHVDFSNNYTGVDCRNCALSSTTATLRLRDFWTRNSNSANVTGTVYVLYSEN